jgi:predicted HTH domain antitoxin
MNVTITLPKEVIAEVDALTKEKKLPNRKQTLRDLILKSLEKERRLRVAKLYQKRRKTLRQCAEMLNVDIEEMMEILREYNVPLSNGSAEDIFKSLKMIREQQPLALKVSLNKDS